MLTRMVQIAISKIALTQKPEKGDPLWRDLSASFQNMDISLIDLVNFIWQGHSFTCTLKPQTAQGGLWRDKKFFAGAQHLCLDFDTSDARSSIETLANDPFIRKRAALLYSSMSSRPLEGKHRTRALFIFDKPIQQAKNVVAANKAALWLYGTADPQCSDPARLWLGSKGCDVMILDNVLPIDMIRDLIEKYDATKRAQLSAYVPQPFNGKNDDAALDRLVAKMRSAGEGYRNATLNDCGFFLGLSVGEGRIDKGWGERALYSAALAVGLDDREIKSTLSHAIQDGMEAHAMNTRTNKP